ncbi:MAG TPA: DALR anticodon-binding domain-containing protein [Streptosporangiaceae bacterium]|nr:DALR anticodon-binding domain-containing protein [Streptosporangiaceae bacterium]
MTPADLDKAVVAAVRAATADGELAGAVPAAAGLRWADGGFVTALPMRLAARGGRTPRQVAEVIARRVGGEVVGPGYLRIEPPDLGALARHIVEAGDYGAADGLAGPTWPDRPRTFDNPGFRLRFAYARAAAVRRYARELGVPAGAPDGLLTEPPERTLLGRLAELPGKNGERYRRHLVRIADAYHDVYERCPALPMGDEPPSPRHGARLTLAEAVRIALNNGLRTLGETPEDRL